MLADVRIAVFPKGLCSQLPNEDGLLALLSAMRSGKFTVEHRSTNNSFAIVSTPNHDFHIYAREEM